MKTGGIFSIGHSTHPIDRFIDLLKQHDIDVVADVRSSPFSKFNPQFNKGSLADSLRNARIKYAFFGKELGARPDDPSCYVDGQVQYARLAERGEFQHAISRLEEGATDHRIALMCAEKEPLDCHRTILVSESLANDGYEVQHILENGELESHNESIERLWKSEIKGTGAKNEDMFSSELEQETLSKQESRIAWQKNMEPTP